MKNLTYKQLLEYLQSLSVMELEQNVTIFVSSLDEYIPAIDIDKSVESDIIDDGQVIILV